MERSVEALRDRQIEDIRVAYDRLEAATKEGKESLKLATAEETRTWETLRQAVEEAIPADQPAAERAEAMLTKLHRTELAWQDFLDAREAKKEEVKAVRSAIKVAKATLDRAIRSSETGQTELF